MKTTAAGLMLALAVAGCTSSAPPPAPGDPADRVVECPAGRPDLCHAKAEQLCPNGYDEKRDGTAAGDPPASTASEVVAAREVTPTSLLISCK